MNPVVPASPAPIACDRESGRIRLAGAWVTGALPLLEANMPEAGGPFSDRVVVDASGVTAMDTGGAWLLLRLLAGIRAGGAELRLEGLQDRYRDLLRLVETRTAEAGEVPPPRRPVGPLEALGRGAQAHLREGLGLLSFLGETTLALGANLARPRRLRWRALASTVETAGLQALPIVGLLSFLLGVVIAYQGGVQLRLYGANIFIVELVSLTMLRELAPMMAAIIVAGRTGSAFTAQIGTMRVTEEVDALRTIGIPPMDLLVLPKLLGLLLALPLLTVFADAMGVLGGMVMAYLMLDVSFREFMDRIPEAVSLTSFMLGIGKAPVFAAIIALVGCYQGFRVSGGADSVGRHTTMSVVQSIFLVIVADAVFSVMFSWLGI